MRTFSLFAISCAALFAVSLAAPPPISFGKGKTEPGKDSDAKNPQYSANGPVLNQGVNEISSHGGGQPPSYKDATKNNNNAPQYTDSDFVGMQYQAYPEYQAPPPKPT